VFTRPELRRVPPEQADGTACVVCGQSFTGKKVAVARMGLPRYDLYTHPKCKPLFRMVTYAQWGSC
jgi:hypothetical protein